MQVTVDELCAAIAAISIVPSRAGITASEFILVKNLGSRISFTLTAEMYGSTYAKVEGEQDQPWRFNVDRASFIPFVLTARELGQKGPFEFTLKDDVLHVKCGNRRATFQKVGADVSGYTEVAPKKGHGSALKLTGEQKFMLKLAAKYATQDPTVAHLNCVYLAKKKAILASDQLSAFYMEDPVVPLSVPMPLLLLRVLDAEQVRSIVVSDTLAKIELSNGYICQVTNKKAASEFPVKALLKNIAAADEYPRKIAVKATLLLEVLSRLVSYISFIVKRELTVTVRGKAGEKRIRLTSYVPSGKFEETVPTVKPISEDFQCEWLLNSLTPLAEVADRLGVLSVCFDEGTSYLFKSKGFRLLTSRKA